MSHRSFGSLASDAPLMEEPSVQNNDMAEPVALDVPEQNDYDDDEPRRVQGFFGVRPWSIRLAPSKPEPIEEPISDSGTSIRAIFSCCSIKSTH
jgi:hypothetical protein